jgi:hypothetical protein
MADKSRSIFWLGYEFGMGLILSIVVTFGLMRIISKAIQWSYYKWFAPLGIHI